MIQYSTLVEAKSSRDALVIALQDAGCNLVRGNTVRCPFCDDNKPSAGVYEANGTGWRFKCLQCGRNGSIVDVMAWSEKVEVEEVLKRFQPANLPITKKKVYATYEELYQAIIRQTQADTIEAVYKYTDPDTRAIDLMVFRCIAKGEKTFRPAMPVEGGFAIESPSVPRPLYNRSRIRTSIDIVVVEGEKCVHALSEFGIVATTSPGGYANAKYADWTPLYEKNVILWPDNDEPGFQYIADVEHKLLSLEYPPSVSTLSPSVLDLQRKEDSADFVDQVKNAFSKSEDRVREIRSALKKAKSKSFSVALRSDYQSIIEGQKRPVHFPHKHLTGLSSALVPSTITILCGNPGASKSLMLLEWLAYWVDTDIKSIVCELEKDRLFHLRRAHAQKAGCAEITNNEWVEANGEIIDRLCEEHSGFIDTIGACIYDGNEAKSSYKQIMDWIIEKAKIGYRVVAIDPITILDAEKESFKEQQKFIQGLNDEVVKKYQTSIILVVHPTKAADHPNLSFLAGSTAFSRFVDTVIWLDIHDPKSSPVFSPCGSTEADHNRTLLILKARNGKGAGAKIACSFDPHTLRLKEEGVIIKKKGQK